MVFILLLVISSLPIVASYNQDTQTAVKIGVVVSILPQAEFVERIGGDKVEVTVMVPPGASPHTYEPTPSQMVSLSNAKLYAKVGSGIDFEIVWMDKLIATNPDILVVDCSQGITLQEMTVTHEHDGEAEEHEEGEMDPHIWTAPRNAIEMVRNITAGLIQIDPSNQTYYEQNRDAFTEELEQLDRDIQQGLSGVTNRSFMVFHPAFGYFASAYNLTMLAIEEEGKEPTAVGLQHLIEEAKEHNIKIIFAEPQFNPQSAEVIANEIEGEVILIDPLAKDYLSNMRAMVDKMIASME